jgi:hypothetical protein
MFDVFGQVVSMPPEPFQFTDFDPAAEDYQSFAFISILLIVLSGAVVFLLRRMDVRLVMLGLLVAIAAIGYGSLIPSAYWTAAILMRIAVLLILCGAAYALLNYPAATVAETRPVEPVLRERPGDVLP